MLWVTFFSLQKVFTLPEEREGGAVEREEVPL